MSRAPLPIVTDHAVLREIERVHGIDVEAVRRHIAHRVRHAVAAGAAGLLSEGHRYIIRSGKVVTVLPGERSHEAEQRNAEADRD